jgi:hypothetical protein
MKVVKACFHWTANGYHLWGLPIFARSEVGFGGECAHQPSSETVSPVFDGDYHRTIERFMCRGNGKVFSVQAVRQEQGVRRRGLGVRGGIVGKIIPWCGAATANLERMIQ